MKKFNLLWGGRISAVGIVMVGVLMASAFSARAAVVSTKTTLATTNDTFTVSSNDLLQTHLGSADDSGLTYYSSPISMLYDGVFLPGNGFSYGAIGIKEGTNIFLLDTGSSPRGYQVTQIDTYSGHADFNRVIQNYTVSYSTVDAPTAFTDIATVSPGAKGPVSEKWSITEGETGILAANVHSIRFVFPYQDLGYVMYKEIDILGELIPFIWDGIGDASWTSPDSTSWTGETYSDGSYVQFLGAGAGTVTIPTTVSPGGITVSNSLGNDYTITGTIGGTGAVIKDGTGKLTLSGSASAYTFSSITIDGGEMDVSGGYNGIVNIDNNGSTYRPYASGTINFPTLNFGSIGGGTVEIGAGNWVKASTMVTTTGGAENFISGGSWNAINSGSGYVYTFNVADGTDASDLTVSTLYNNFPKILKTGDGTLTLTCIGNNIAPTTVDQGTLLFNGTATATPATSPYYGNPVTVNNTATLGGTGTIIDPVSVLAGGTLAAGDVSRIGTLTMTNGLTFASASATNVVRVTGAGATQTNKIVVTGGVISLGSATLVIDDTGLSDIPVHHILTVIDNQTASAISGTFEGLAEGATVSGMNGSLWVVSYSGGTGNDVVLTPAPKGTVISIK